MADLGDFGDFLPIFGDFWRFFADFADFCWIFADFLLILPIFADFWGIFWKQVVPPPHFLKTGSPPYVDYMYFW